MEEVWRDVQGFEGLYEVSSLGNVRSPRGVVTPYKSSKVYLKVGLFKNCKDHKRRVNRLVAQAFIPNPNDYPCVYYRDGNKENNSVNNLEWGERNRGKSHEMH